MLTQIELSDYIGQQMPELSDICSREKSRTAYDVIRHMLKYTKSQVIQHNLNAARKCMLLAEQLYYKGNNVIKNAIEHEYIFSFSHAFFCNEEEKNEVMPLVPPFLYKLYRQQMINGSHL